MMAICRKMRTPVWRVCRDFHRDDRVEEGSNAGIANADVTTEKAQNCNITDIFISIVNVRRAHGGDHVCKASHFHEVANNS